MSQSSVATRVPINITVGHATFCNEDVCSYKKKKTEKSKDKKKEKNEKNIGGKAERNDRELTHLCQLTKLDPAFQ